MRNHFSAFFLLVLSLVPALGGSVDDDLHDRLALTHALHAEISSYLAYTTASQLCKTAQESFDETDTDRIAVTISGSCFIGTAAATGIALNHTERAMVFIRDLEQCDRSMKRSLLRKIENVRSALQRVRSLLEGNRLSYNRSGVIALNKELSEIKKASDDLLQTITDYAKSLSDAPETSGGAEQLL